jgi:hypothetical protein
MHQLIPLSVLQNTPPIIANGKEYVATFGNTPACQSGAQSCGQVVEYGF